MRHLLVLIGLSFGFATTSFALPIHASSNKTAEELSKIFNSNKTYHYNGIVKLDDCSGSVIRFENAKDSDKGLVLSNGHCVSTGLFGGMIQPGQFLSNQTATRKFQILKDNGDLSNNSLVSTKLIYATMTGTDISLYELSQSYAEIKSKYGVNAIIVDSVHPQLNDAIDILSGYWQRGYSCTIDEFVFQLEEGGYFMDDSIRYVEGGCLTIHGTSGSPVLSANTGKLIGINNTGNDNGERCTMDNPCEHNQAGDTYFEKGRSYAEETYQMYTCLNSDGAFDLTVAGCKLHH